MQQNWQHKILSKKLGLALSTVELHRSRVMTKMETKTLAELIRSCLILESNMLI